MQGLSRRTYAPNLHCSTKEVNESLQGIFAIIYDLTNVVLAPFNLLMFERVRN